MTPSSAEVDSRTVVDDLLRPTRRKAAPARVRPEAPARERVFSDGEVAGAQYGFGETVLLVHGWEADRADMTAFVDPLVAAGFAPLVIDLPAHGLSRGERVAIPQLAEAIARVAAEAGPLGGIVAHSLGAAVTAAAIERGLVPRRVVFVAPPENYGAYVRSFIATLGCDANGRNRILAELQQRIGMHPDRVDTPAFLAACDIPGLILHSADDRVVDVSSSRALAKVWPAARLVEFENLGHRRILVDPRAISEVVEFLAHGNGR